MLCYGQQIQCLMLIALFPVCDLGFFWRGGLHWRAWCGVCCRDTKFAKEMEVCFISELCFGQPAGCAKQDLPKILGETEKKRKNRAEKRLLMMCWDVCWQSSSAWGRNEGSWGLKFVVIFSSDFENALMLKKKRQKHFLLCVFFFLMSF